MSERNSTGHSVEIAIGVVVLILAIVIGWLVFGTGGHKKHHATCWQPTYAAHPSAAWARDPSATHRHGAGSKPGVCGP
jgi:hypothetical protein